MIHTLILATVLAAPLTLSEAIRAAMTNFPGVAASANQTEAARAVVEELESSRLPSLSFAATGVHHSDPMLAIPIHEFDLNNRFPFDRTLLQSAITANYSLYDAGARGARIEEAQHIAESAGAATDAARQNAGARAAVAYTTVLGRAAIADAHGMRITALEAERARVLLLREVGRAARVEELRVDASIAAAVAERGDATAALESAERTLARITGLPLEDTRGSNLVPVSEAALPLPHRDTLERETSGSPLVRQARAREAAQQATIDFERRGRRPEVFASAQELFYATPWAMLEDNWNVGVALRFNFFDGGATSSRIARATASALAATEEVRSAEVETGIALDRAIAELQQSRDTAIGLASAVEKFEEVARIQKLLLENGAGTQADYLRAEADLLAARANLAAARYRAVAARVEIARITGDLSPDWIATNLGAAP